MHLNQIVRISLTSVTEKNIYTYLYTQKLNHIHCTKMQTDIAIKRTVHNTTIPEI